MMTLGDTVWLKNPTSQNSPHLFFAIADNGNRVLLANMSDFGPGVDNSCVLSVGDHPAVKKESAIKYLEMIHPLKRDLDTAIAAGVGRPDEPASQELIRRIQEGGLQSDFTRPEYEKIIRAVIA